VRGEDARRRRYENDGVGLVGHCWHHGDSGQDITGEWNGTLKVGQAELRLALHVSKGADNNLKATLDSIDHGANGLPGENCRMDSETIQQVIRADTSLHEFTLAVPRMLSGERILIGSPAGARHHSK
jgi:hypothetical protein